jgi:hypothetical protein
MLLFAQHADGPSPTPHAPRVPHRARRDVDCTIGPEERAGATLFCGTPLRRRAHRENHVGDNDGTDLQSRDAGSGDNVLLPILTDLQRTGQFGA